MKKKKLEKKEEDHSKEMEECFNISMLKEIEETERQKQAYIEEQEEQNERDI